MGSGRGNLKIFGVDGADLNRCAGQISCVAVGRLERLSGRFWVGSLLFTASDPVHQNIRFSNLLGLPRLNPRAGAAKPTFQDAKAQAAESSRQTGRKRSRGNAGV